MHSLALVAAMFSTFTRQCFTSWRWFTISSTKSRTTRERPRRVVDHDDAEVVKERDRRGPARPSPACCASADATA